jgi:hypothetical protein
MSITTKMTKMIKKIFGSKNIDDIEPMKQETHKPEYVSPLVVSSVKNSSRIKYRR